jgi:hypothetical protein
MRIHALLLPAAAAVLLFAAPVFAQQPAPEGNNPDDVPTFSNADVAPTQVVPAGEPDAQEPVDPSLTPEERADVDSGEEGTPQAGGGTTRKKGPSAAELKWRRDYEAAKERSRAATAAAQEAEIQQTQLRNQLASTGTAQQRNAVAQQMEALGVRIQELKEAAARAKQELARVEEEGRVRKFKQAAGPSPRTKSGRTNPDYIRDQYSKAAASLQDAERRASLYQFRVSDLQTRITNNSGSGDQYTQMRLQGELNEALRGLEEARADRVAAATALDQARRDAANAGITLPRE